MDIEEQVKQAIEEFAAADAELGWEGAPEVAQHAEEIAGFLSARNLLR